MGDASWSHDALQHDLAMHLRLGGKKLVWENIPLGPSGSPRPDVLSMVPYSFAHPEFTAYEIKVSTSDLRADVTYGKWQSYLCAAECVIFALPHGMAKKDDIPKECGLMVRSERGWRTVRKGMRRTFELDHVLALKLISAQPAWRRTGRKFLNETEGVQVHWREWARKEALACAGRNLSKDIAEAVRANIEGREQSFVAVKRLISGAEEQRDKILAECADLLRALGVDPNTPTWNITTEVRRRADLLIAGESAVAMLSRACDDAAKALERGRLLVDLAAAPPPLGLRNVKAGAK